MYVALISVLLIFFRIQLKNPASGEEKVLYLRPDEEKNDKLFKDSECGLDLDIIDRIQMTEWLVNNYQKFGATLEFITNRSQEGSQFQKGFGGFGGTHQSITQLELWSLT